MKEQIVALLKEAQNRLSEYRRAGGSDTAYLEGKVAGLREALDLFA